MKVAILDLGTNTFNIFIAEIHPDKTYTKLYKSKISVKLGEGGINNHFIAEKPFKRGISALMRHKGTSRKFGADQIVAYATSAIRSSSNGKDFVRIAKEKAGIEVQVITGDREAELIYLGVRMGVQMSDAPALIIDIGGGSTEFIIANKKEIFWKQSFQLGAARLLEKIKPSDPITQTQVRQIEEHLEENLQPLFKAVLSPFGGQPEVGSAARGGGPLKRSTSGMELIGSSGTFDSMADMIGCRFYNTDVLKGKTEYCFDMADFEKLHRIILGSITKERLKMEGLTKMRVDMIVVSSVFVNFILSRLNLKKMRVSKFSLKEGVLWEMMNK